MDFTEEAINQFIDTWGKEFAEKLTEGEAHPLVYSVATERSRIHHHASLRRICGRSNTPGRLIRNRETSRGCLILKNVGQKCRTRAMKGY